MKISKELIEKYHSGHCTPDEKKAVEAWLFDDEATTEPTLPLPTGESKFEIREEMWNEIATVLPSRQKPAVLAFFRPFWRQAAAVLLICLAGVAVFYLKNREADSGVIVVNNVSDTANQNLHESAYSIAIGPKSNVEINHETGRIDFCGAMMINPNRDIELTIQGICARPDEKSEKRILKKGQNYIALNYGNAANPNEVIILPQGSLTGLPPLMQRQLMMQFDI
ncbi:hypothetical protein [Larkinella punicea]|uniref:FecR protein domain-containing protein n=1 Tax=Larkinella punicea TaxID=2315727 RepID=A0A368JM37_9BACT|nr:hypothetical protein [Larkinella punicea]RCR67211.1 hypothetical protein DUE52_23140 [Larkinella punicea]